MKGVTLAVLAFALAGCGGAEDDATYSRDATRACLKAQGFEITDDNPDYSFVGAIEPSRGAFSAEKGDEGIELAFGADRDEAKEMEEKAKDSAEVFGKVFGADAGDVVFSKRNVTYWWTVEETTSRDTVEGCLTG